MKGSAIREMIITLAIAAALAFGVQGYLVKPYKIPSASMENTLKCGDRVLVDRIGYRLHDPKHQDIVVFHPPREDGLEDDVVPSADQPPWSNDREVHQSHSSQTYIKRIVGVPGDELEVKNRIVYIDGKKTDEPYVHPVPEGSDAPNSPSFNYGPIKVPKGTYFMMGDNRTQSADGRWFGPVKRSFIIGHAFAFYWPLGKVGGISSSEAGTLAPDPGCSLG